ncbi:MAG: HEPN domain-containing protein [archaeon]
MSEASKNLDWCIKKASKETEECKKLGKRIKHRGLLKIDPNIDEAKKHIKKAEHNFQGITKFKEIGFSDWSITAGFYCIYHCFLAIALKFGYESRNQSCTISLIESLKEEGKIDIDVKFIDLLKYEDIEERHENTVIEERENYTYGVNVSVKDEKEIKDLIKNCKEIIDITKRIVFE